MSQNLLNPSDLMSLSPKQKLAIATSNAPVNIWHGSVRAGKTYSSALRFLIELQEAREGEMAVICRDAFSFRRNVLPLLYQLIGDDVRYLEGKGLLNIWGRNIHVIGAHDVRAEGKIRGATFVGAYVDEASLIPHSAWLVLLQRCAMGGARVFATTNPDSPAHWLKKDFIDNNPDVKSFHFNMLDNPMLTEKERAYLARQHQGIYYKRFVLGEWCLAEGAVFEFFDKEEQTISKIPANAEYYIVGVDIGFTNPTAFTLIGYNPWITPKLWVEDLYYWDAREKGRAKTDTEYADDFIKFISGRPNIRFAYVDPAAASFKIELRRRELSVPIRDAENEVVEGIAALSSLMNDGDLKIHRSCHKLIEEVQAYCWDSKASEKGEDKPIKRFDHAIDAMRYAIYTHFGNRPLTGYKVEEEARLGNNSLRKGHTLVSQISSRRTSFF